MDSAKRTMHDSLRPATRNRREVVKTTAGLTGAAALSRPMIANAAQSTPAATPAVPEGAIASAVEGVPIA